MVGLGALWLPVLVSAVIVFAVSSLIHIITPWHQNDYRKLSREADVLDALRTLAVPPGDYMAPQPADMKEYKSAEFAEKMKKGPVVILTLMSGGGTGMGKNLVMWFVYLVVVSIFAGYVTGRALQPGSPYMSVFRFAGTTAFLGYSVSLWQMSIWYQRSWVTTLKGTIDGLLYALLTAGVFGWLWPN